MAIITLNNNSLSSVTALPAGVGGKVLQVVRNSSTTTVTSSSNSSHTELINTSITPSSTSSKILILVNVMMAITAGSNAYSAITVRKGTISGTELKEYYIGNAAGNNLSGLYSINTIDEPSTTNSQQYTLGIRKASSATTSVSTDGGLYEIKLLEIAG
jgi:hypothetical protein